MENIKLTELRKIAKERINKYYYRMRKADLIRELGQRSHILDEPIPKHITQNALTPSQYVLSKYINIVNNKINSFANWIMSVVPEPIKNTTNEKIESIKSTVSNLYKRFRVRKPIEFKLTQSAVRNVTKQFSAKGVEGYDALSFMKSFINNAIKILNSNKGSKIYIVLSLRIEHPEPNTMIEFTNYNRSMRVPFVVYADFESFITPINTSSPNPNESYTKQYQKHTPSSFLKKNDVAKKFVDMLEEDIKKIYNTYLKFPKKMIFTPEDKNSFNNAKVCHICEEELKDDRKLSERKLSCIPNNEKKYISFSKELKVGEYTNKDNKVIEVKLQLRFVDSYRFMASSLDSLSKNLTKELCKNIGKYYSGNDLDLLLRKEADLEYPENLHDAHNDYPLAPERLKIFKVDKLVPNLNHKKNYIIHYENLKLYERLRLKITKIHRGIKFEESAWLRKTMENINLEKQWRILKTEFKQDLYEFNYDYIKSKYGDEARLLFTDTDSLAYEIKTKDFYSDISNDVESKFDTSEFDKNHPAIQNGFKVGLNKKEFGKFKDEVGGAQIKEFVEEINKIALSAEDDKRTILEDSIHALAYGHYKLVPMNPKDLAEHGSLQDLEEKPNFSFQIDWNESDSIGKPNFSFQIDWK
nr:uncharacterized protein LOC124818177 [Hydra vulgaris]